MDTYRDEKRLLRYTYLFIVVCSLNLFIIKDPLDFGALIMGAVMIVLLAYTYFILRRFFPDGDKYIFIFSSMLTALGLVMIYRLDRGLAIKQIVWLILGIAIFIFIVVLVPELKRFKKFKYIYMVLTLAFMAMATFIGTEIFGAKNWVYVGPISFQPSEFGKVFLILYLAAALEEYENFKQLIEPAFIVMVSLGFMILQRDLGTALMIFAISLTMLYISTSKLKYILTCLALFAIGATLSYFLFYHVRRRVLIWHDPWPYVGNESYQLVQGYYGIAMGGLFGSGLGLGHPEFVAVRESDLIFSVIAEEMGMLVGFAVLILHFLLFYRNIRGAIYAKSNFTKLLTVGLSTMIATQTLVIVGGVTGFIPLTGITLPLVSYGGTSLLITFISLGIIQKVSEGE
ncbi:FtsW/RodA/SpoVE family cell cycle protein [Clostridium cellulovorans]|uniref:Cell cycle protein n=1 Tax=Clostridium cellulovorans (strain ATCC 35296 / DSM 3052 / OCM 3 / 743B) TaxID=573061 RepID=D9SQ83_CLOC7|nr:FtsW/RodA/SpoVE family cell cycle protein [Clostridium cellulovorans]ADL50150.1 cell cycle protein [Clostridium cellulovorans 743B]